MPNCLPALWLREYLYTQKEGLETSVLSIYWKKKGGKFYIEQDGAVEEKQGKQDDNVFSFLCISF